MKCSRPFSALLSLGVCGMFLMQFGSCTFEQVNELVQTALLGVTAAGAVAIIRNL